MPLHPLSESMGVDHKPLISNEKTDVAVARRIVFPPAELIMAMGSVLMTCTNVSVKSLQVPLIELAQGRYLAQWFLTCSALALRSYLSGEPFRPFGPPGQRRWLLLRSAVYFTFILLWWATLRLVPVGDAVVIVQFQVFIVGLLSRGLFGKKLSARWWIGCVVAFFGVVLVVRPPFLFGGIPANSNVGAGSVSLGTCLNILAAAFGALTNVLVKFAPEAHFLEVQHCTDFMCGVVLCPPLLLAFGTPSVLANLAVQESILIVAAFGVGGLCLVILGYQLGNPGRIAVVSYLEVPCAYVAQVVLFGNAVEWPAILGSFLIVAAAFAVVTEKDEAN